MTDSLEVINDRPIGGAVGTPDAPFDEACEPEAISTEPSPPEGYELLTWTSGFGAQMSPVYAQELPSGHMRRGFFIKEHHLNGNGTCHGGMLMSFADICFGLALGHTYEKWVTVRLLTDFLSSAQLGDWVEGDGEVTADVDGFVTTKGQLWCGERVLMTGTAVYKGLERKSGLK